MPDVTTSRLGRAFSVVALLEAATWAGLLIGMVLKHVTRTTELGVQVFGQLHGIMFLVYVVVALVASYRLRWGWWVTGLALAAAVPPLTTIPLERWLRARGLAGPTAIPGGHLGRRDTDEREPAAVG
ncbi:DUF3817 domain-containing protein [Actinotalea sp. BY-33]|uniref:DUF3817 domain-containing protein n=1 Tax=Actinotalea soli TaxID=2819234 RepID=A0A939RUL5_9CELL|nr:DUF3817 domain-containing protein [Actinotalea soli]MBO1751480.1 DUF3817 domain-containing protein [Actinotalea soli]